MARKVYNTCWVLLWKYLPPKTVPMCLALKLYLKSLVFLFFFFVLLEPIFEFLLAKNPNLVLIQQRFAGNASVWNAPDIVSSPKSSWLSSPFTSFSKRHANPTALNRVFRRISPSSLVDTSATLTTQVKRGKKTSGNDPQISRTKHSSNMVRRGQTCVCFCSVPTCMVYAGPTESTHVRTKPTRGRVSGRVALERSYADRLPPRTSRGTPMGAAMLAPVTWPREPRSSAHWSSRALKAQKRWSSGRRVRARAWAGLQEPGLASASGVEASSSVCGQLASTRRGWLRPQFSLWASRPIRDGRKSSCKCSLQYL